MNLGQHVVDGHEVEERGGIAVGHAAAVADSLRHGPQLYQRLVRRNARGGKEERKRKTIKRKAW